MENSNLIIRIQEPCHEDWTNMLPDPNGKFCTSCSKSVVDFSNKSDAEIQIILLENKDQQVCGHFKKTQINRPLNIRIDLNDLPKNVSSTKTFAIALFLVFGTFLFSCTDLQGKKVDTIEVVNNKMEEHTMGAIEMPVIVPEDTIPMIKSLPTECYISETHVAGGISIERVPEPVDTIPIITGVENYVMGLMIANVVEQKDTTVTDSLSNEQLRSFEQSVITATQTTLSVFPNPGNGEFNIKYDVLKRADVRIDILDLKGSLMKTIVNIENQFEGKYQIPVNVSELPNGIYIVNLMNNGKRFTEKLIIEK